MNVTELPFNQFLGLHETGSGGEIALSPQPQHLNHVRTLHAAVLYGLAEAASGQALLSRFPQLTGQFGAVLRHSSVKYRKPGQVTADCVAGAVIDEVAARGFLSLLDARGRAMLDIEATVRQHEIILMSGTFTWFAARNENSTQP